MTVMTDAQWTVSQIDAVKLSDTANAERMAEVYGAMVRYIEEYKCFAVYNGKYWEIDRSGSVIMSMSKIIARSFYEDAKSADDDRISDAFAKHAKLAQGLARRQAMVELLKSEPGITVSINQFDRDIYFLNCRNGIVDLRTGKLQEHAAEYMITKFCDVEYKDAVEFPLWCKFLDSTFKSKADIIEFVQRSLGMSCTGDVSNQAVFLPYGRGWNGKSTLLHSVQQALGPDYTVEVDPSIFMDGKDNSGPNEGIASLYKKRLVISTETKQGQSLSTDLIKRMTGGEQLPHNEKYQHQFMFTPEFKLWLSGNHRAHISDTTDSIWLRLKQIPFECDFRPGQDGYNSNMRSELTTETGKEAILSWLVDGCKKWYQSNKDLSEPKDVIVATEEYRRDQDMIIDFLTECCKVGTEFETLAGDIWKSYIAHCKLNERYQLGQRTFYERLREKGFKDKVGHANKKYFQNIALLAENEVNGPEMVSLVTSSYAFSRKYTTREIQLDFIGKPLTLNNQPNQTNQINLLPDCPKCGKNEWCLDPEMKYYVCLCGQKMEAGL